MLFPLESSTCCKPSLPVVVCRVKLCPPITSGVPLPVVMVSPSLLCVMEMPVKRRKLLHQLVALVLNRAAALSGRGTLRELPIQLRDLRGQRVDLRHRLRHLAIGIRLRGGKPVGGGVEGIGKILACRQHALLRGRTGRIRGQLREAGGKRRQLAGDVVARRGGEIGLYLLQS